MKVRLSESLVYNFKKLKKQQQVKDQVYIAKDELQDNNLFGFPQEHIEVSENSTNNSQQNNPELNRDMQQTANFGFSGQDESKEKNQDHKQKQYNFYKQLAKQKYHKKSLSSQFNNIPLILKKSETDHIRFQSNRFSWNTKLDMNFQQFPVQIKKHRSDSQQIDFNPNQKATFNNSFKLVNDNYSLIQKNNFVNEILQSAKLRKIEEKEQRNVQCFSANPIQRNTQQSSMNNLNETNNNNDGNTDNDRFYKPQLNILPQLRVQKRNLYSNEKNKSTQFHKNQLKLIDRLFGEKQNATDQK